MSFGDLMIDAIVTAMESDSVVATPTEDADLSKLVGHKAVYTDTGNKDWQGKVVAVEEPGVVVKFSNFPTGIGQGHMLQIED